jgi:anaerobic selenocysteine-containing dehydrogenase
VASLALVGRSHERAAVGSPGVDHSCDRLRSQVGAVGEHAPLHARQRPTEAIPQAPPRAREEPVSGLRLVTYHPLFSGPAVERVPELQFQRPAPEVEIAFADAQRLGIANGDEVEVRSIGTSVRLRARVSRKLKAGVVRAADEHARDLGRSVEVTKA